jgi:hypothetical protein
MIRVTRGARTTEDLYKIPPQKLQCDIRPLDNETGDGILCGMRQEMLSFTADGAHGVDTGVGSDFIILKWGDRWALIRARPAPSICGDV